MAVLPDAEQDEIQARRFVGCPEELSQLLLVGCCGFCRRQLAAHPVDAPDGDAREQGTLGHPVVRVLVVRRDGPFVPKEDVNLAPVEPVGVVAGEYLVGCLRGRAAGERDCETISLGYRCFGLRCEVAGGSLGELLRVLLDEEVQRSRMATAIRRALS